MQQLANDRLFPSTDKQSVEGERQATSPRSAERCGDGTLPIFSWPIPSTGCISKPVFFIAETADLGGQLPADWVPSPNCEPLDTPAVNAFYAAGPSGRGGGGQTYWLASSVPDNPSVMAWTLTGLGLGMPPVFA